MYHYSRDGKYSFNRKLFIVLFKEFLQIISEAFHNHHAITLRIFLVNS